MFAGSTLLISMIVALFIVPGSLLASLAGTVAMVVVLSVLVATVVGPALLALIGPNLDRWRIGPAPNGKSRLMDFVHAALRRPAPVAALIGAVVLLLAAPALALKTGPPSPEQLSKSDPARRDAELIDRSIGPGWDAPFQIVATTDNGPITEPARLAALGRWQRRIAALPGVQAVIGPGQIGRPGRAAARNRQRPARLRRQDRGRSASSARSAAGWRSPPEASPSCGKASPRPAPAPACSPRDPGRRPPERWRSHTASRVAAAGSQRAVDRARRLRQGDAPTWPRPSRKPRSARCS